MTKPPSISRAYLLKEELRALHHLEARTAASEHLRAWLAWASRSRLRPFVKLARTIRRHRDGILAAIRLGLANARLEGLNSKVRLISRRSFGFHGPDPSPSSFTSAQAASRSTHLSPPTCEENRFQDREQRPSEAARVLAGRGDVSGGGRRSSRRPEESSGARGKFPT
jgi:Transposase